jgi:hypothetical protein
MVRLKPYEKEIRHLLLQNEPSLLHKVDDLLEQYKGEENVLLEILRENCNNKSSKNEKKGCN